MKDERLSSINPYFPRENGGCIYPYFFDMYAGGRLILDTLDDMYKSMKIEDFMKNSYECNSRLNGMPFPIETECCFLV